MNVCVCEYVCVVYVWVGSGCVCVGVYVCLNSIAFYLLQTDDPRHFGNLRDDYFRPHPFPSHLPPEELRPWPSHHHSFEDRMFPRNIPHPRDHAPSFPPETDRFGRDISKRMEYEDTRSYRRTDRHLPPAYPSREGGFQDEYPPLSGRRARGPGIPWDPRGRMHPFHDAPLMVKRRRSSEDASRSPTPLADMHSDSDSSPEPERSKSSSHRHYKSGPPSSKGSSHRGQPGKDKSKVDNVRHILCHVASFFYC